MSCNVKGKSKKTPTSDDCIVDLDLYPNTYNANNALSNLNVLDKVYMGMKRSVIHYLNNLNALYMNLSEAQEPNKLTLVQNLERFKVLQQALINEIKTISETKFSDGTNSVSTIVTSVKVDNFSKKDGSLPNEYFKDQKKILSKRLFVKFSDETIIEFLSVPSFIFNLDKFNDSITLKISQANNNLLASNAFFRGSDNETFLFINSDTNDGYLYKDASGDYHPDRADAYNFDENIKSSVSSVLEFYESIVNIGNYQDVGHPDGETFISGSDIHIFLNLLDIEIKKNKLARRMICIRTDID